MCPVTPPGSSSACVRSSFDGEQKSQQREHGTVQRACRCTNVIVRNTLAANRTRGICSRDTVIIIGPRGAVIRTCSQVAAAGGSKVAAASHNGQPQRSVAAVSRSGLVDII